MSTRTVIEINHDYLGDYERHPEYWTNLKIKLGFGISDERMERLHPTPGVRVLGQRHHTETLNLVIR